MIVDHGHAATKMSRIILSIGILILITVSVTAYTTNGTEKQFDYTISGTTGSQSTSANYGTYLTVDTTSEQMNSSNYFNHLGFLVTAPYLNGESCDLNIECASNACCDGVCASSCNATGSSSSSSSTSTTTGSGGGGGGRRNRTIEETEVPFYFIKKIEEQTSETIGIVEKDLSVYTIKITARQDLENIEIIINSRTSIPSHLDNALQYFEIKSEKLNPETVEEIILQFKIPIDDLTTAQLYHYDEGEWKPLKTTLIYKDDTYLFFESVTKTVGIFGVQKQSQESQKPIPEKPQEVETEKETKVEENNINPAKDPFNYAYIVGATLITIAFGVLYLDKKKIKGKKKKKRKRATKKRKAKKTKKRKKSTKSSKGKAHK